MKRISLILGIAAFAAISAPLSAQSGGKYGRNGERIYDRNGDGRIDDRDNQVYDRNGDGRIDNRDQVGTNCSWWETNCSNNSNARSNSTSEWYLIGRDLDGNGIYERRITDKHGRTTVETARRNSNGRLVVIDKRRVDDRYNTRNSRNSTQGVYDRNGRRIR